MAGWPALFTAVVYFIEGRLLAQKVATNFAMPVGILWVLLSGIALLGWARRSRALIFVGLVSWLVLTVAGSPILATMITRSLEDRYREIHPLEVEEPFDAVIVLGGGTAVTPSGEPALGPGGDRVMLAARMYLTGKTKLLICTGRTLKDDGTLGPSESTHIILKDLGIPASALLELEGRTTSEEMVAIREWQEENDARHVGLLTSAWHLPRAERLAAASGVDVEPIPADFKTYELWDSRRLMPSSTALEESSIMLKEYLAGIVGR